MVQQRLDQRLTASPNVTFILFACAVLCPYTLTISSFEFGHVAFHAEDQSKTARSDKQSNAVPLSWLILGKGRLGTVEKDRIGTVELADFWKR